jgi:hypothetical protein
MMSGASVHRLGQRCNAILTKADAWVVCGICRTVKVAASPSHFRQVREMAGTWPKQPETARACRDRLISELDVIHVSSTFDLFALCQSTSLQTLSSVYICKNPTLFLTYRSIINSTSTVLENFTASLESQLSIIIFNLHHEGSHTRRKGCSL